MHELVSMRCTPCEGGMSPLTTDQVNQLLSHLPCWRRNADATHIKREFRFKNFHATMEFVNDLAWIAHREDHHPDLEVSYNRCQVTYSTHSIKGLSENDFICAAKIDALLE